MKKMRKGEMKEEIKNELIKQIRSNAIKHIFYELNNVIVTVVQLKTQVNIITSKGAKSTPVVEAMAAAVTRAVALVATAATAIQVEESPANLVGLWINRTVAMKEENMNLDAVLAVGAIVEMANKVVVIVVEKEPLNKDVINYINKIMLSIITNVKYIKSFLKKISESSENPQYPQINEEEDETELHEMMEKMKAAAKREEDAAIAAKRRMRAVAAWRERVEGLVTAVETAVAEVEKYLSEIILPNGGKRKSRKSKLSKKLRKRKSKSSKKSRTNPRKKSKK
jgi:hypothetical protein